MSAPEQPRRSGLRNPERAVRGLGAGILGLEALVLVLAIQPIRVVGGGLSGAAVAVVVALAVLAVLLYLALPTVLGRDGAGSRALASVTVVPAPSGTPSGTATRQRSPRGACP